MDFKKDLSKQKYKETIDNLKAGLKALAIGIRHEKGRRKEYRGNPPGLEELQHKYRVWHIARCLIRGRTIEQIENSRLKKKPAGHQENLLQLRVSHTVQQATGLSYSQSGKNYCACKSCLDLQKAMLMETDDDGTVVAVCAG